MNPPSTTTGMAAIVVMMIAAGMGIPLMASLNAALSQHIASPTAAATILFGLGFLLAGGALLVSGLPARGAFAGAPWYLFAGAPLVVFYILSITWSAPRIGIGNAVFFVLLGQLAAAAAIDHFGLFGGLRTAITSRRALGLCVMAFGVYLARKPT